MVTTHNIENPEGLDKVIGQCQESLKKLLGWDKGNIYGRGVPLKIDNQILPCAYMSNGEYYKGLIALEDEEAFKVFYLPTGEAKYLPGGQFEQVIKTVFVVDLSKLFAEATHLADLDAQAVAVKAMERIPTFKNIQGVTTTTASVLKGFYSMGKVELYDVYPKHIFSVNSSVKYFSKKPMYNCNC